MSPEILNTEHVVALENGCPRGNTPNLDGVEAKVAYKGGTVLYFEACWIQNLEPIHAMLAKSARRYHTEPVRACCESCQAPVELI